ncbi:hypothetical protein SAMN05421823_101311 [Catalinimonas alkaloidigena]|uniref:NADPH-dependent FMN reductase n=1 Tax=Catalinimonas alkaloidigena TaxID=1075417 RepID=A0A1G8XCH2_9BACT|nr:hypothetical protein [Catalinimonas alkaloidigena]SDJ87470.1 hypothetical protein SAMN05421823_101311 [Catalinimonas alkaloidigena]
MRALLIDCTLAQPASSETEHLMAHAKEAFRHRGLAMRSVRLADYTALPGKSQAFLQYLRQSEILLLGVSPQHDSYLHDLQRALDRLQQHSQRQQRNPFAGKVAGGMLMNATPLGPEIIQEVMARLTLLGCTATSVNDLLLADGFPAEALSPRPHPDRYPEIDYLVSNLIYFAGLMRPEPVLVRRG